MYKRQVFGLGGGKSFHIDCINRVLLCRPLRLTQFEAYIAGEAVSYTHLDVYKRQGRDFMIEQLIAEATECDFKVALETKKPKSWLKSVSALSLIHI